jgi:hypothetical protein
MQTQTTILIRQLTAITQRLQAEVTRLEEMINQGLEPPRVQIELVKQLRIEERKLRYELTGIEYMGTL